MRILPVLIYTSVFVVPAVRAAIEASGTTLNVSTDALRLTFQGGDITALHNVLTSEDYLRGRSPTPLTTITLPASVVMTPGNWSVNAVRNSAEPVRSRPGPLGPAPGSRVQPALSHVEFLELILNDEINASEQRDGRGVLPRSKTSRIR